jgi:hypothetical protein
MDLEIIGRQLASIYGGSPWIVIADASAGATPNVAQLRDWGVDRILVISATEGVGPQPEGAEIHLTHSHGSTVMGGFRAFAKSLASKPVADAIAAFDPVDRARVLAPPFGAESAFEGRRPYGARRPEWLGLEDKTVIDEHFAQAGVETASHEVVGIDDARAVARRLASEAGSVWVADNREGWHGGGEYVRWVRRPEDEAEVLAWFRGHADRVRVMPFLEGIPCSIHGYVTDSGVAAFRPVEMLIARHEGSSEFRYLGMATTWDPAPRIREEMRAVARKMARHLDRTVRYRGPFSIDGVLTRKGFRPTELNPRMSAGFGIQAARVTELRIGLLTRAIVEGDIDVDPSALEDLIVTAADRKRTLRVGIPVPESREADSIPILIVEDVVERTDGRSHGTLEIGPAPAGSYVLLRPDQEHVPVGRSAAGLAASAARLAAKTWDLAMGDLQPST